MYVSGNGKRVLLITPSGCIFLWEYLEFKTILSSKSPSLVGQWSQIIPEEAVHLPSNEDKEAVVHAVFIRNEVKSELDRVLLKMRSQTLRTDTVKLLSRVCNSIAIYL